MPSGLLLLDKPAGLSSNAALQRVRRACGARKAGHVGSLDPLATGMLPICLDEATKLAGEILQGRKKYRFTVTLGTRTATGDVEGAPVETAPVPVLEREQVERVLQDFLGPQKQVPPMYSAIKRGGQPLYRLAREGIEVEREPRDIEVFELVLTRFEPPRLELEALCSKGTYVRSLAEDIARALGTCGHVSALRRLYVEPFDSEPMVTLEEIEAACRMGAPLPFVPLERALGHLPQVVLDHAAADRLRHGQPVAAGIGRAARVRLYDESGCFLGLGEAEPSGRVLPRRLFVTPLPSGRPS
ncbi:MAG: tRNA pseudouridine(55) synthase TruB [Pseudomonadota bacterium]|jgi:tRNA pseudouridine 55 synthase|nr:MAG: tRNA pseudouridine(55) synthase TruB [Pseudomonadota bacterium]